MHIQSQDKIQKTNFHSTELSRGFTDTFESAFKYSGIGMALINRQGRWIDVNDALCSMLGYSKEELSLLNFQDITYPDDLEGDMSFVRKILKKEIETYGLEKRYISKDNKIVYVRLTVSPVWNINGSFKFFISQIVDISANRGLIDQLSRKNSELEAIQISLVNKLHQLEDLNYIIAHNLRGPSNSIQALTDILKVELESIKITGPTNKNLTEMEQVVNMISEGSKALTSSLDTMMEVAKIGLNKSIPVDECDVEEIAQAIISQLHSTIFEKRAIIKFFLTIPLLQYPKVYLESILYNFISNALKYCKPDVPPQIILSTYEQNERIILSVKDNGLGIDMEKYADRLFKLNQVFHEGYDSKGIGLFITKSQIESMGGRIDVLSKPMEGSEFVVTL